jgi:HTH-type transcriptional regulator / antitoxin HipB
MQLHQDNLIILATQLAVRRKSQGLTRSQLAGVCGLSESFIRDAESMPGRCSLAKLMLLVQGLQLNFAVGGWDADASLGKDTENKQNDSSVGSRGAA